ncbi:hypothetical protein [Salinispora cortesiana]|uniref:hypothetical protein n=1 Tax=Salinispora cortesiana TaxID=1305843 RepID=UPI0003FDE049|nr:hypothetical protein [Salinispora cortesiana]
MAWSDWPLIVVALLVGAAAGWVVRGRRKAARAGTTGDATPASSTTTTAVGEPTSTSAGTNTNGDTDADRSRATDAAPEQAPTAPEQATTASEQVDPAPAQEHTPAANGSQTEPADADAATPPVVAESPVQPDTEAADRGPVPTEPELQPAASKLEPDAADDFRRIQGVGPKMAAGLQAAGIRTYQQLAELDEPALRELIRAAGLRGAASLPTWPRQAKALAEAAVASSTGGSADA